MKESSLEKITKAISSEIDAFGEVMDVTKFRELQKQLEKFLIRDALTLVLNRWKFEDVLKREMKRAKDNCSNLYLVMFDVDKFKKINDTLGHNVGDELLRNLTADIEFLVEGTVGKSHRFGRWGGDEFLYIFPDTTLLKVTKIINDVMSDIRVKSSNHAHYNSVTVSVGIAQLKKKDTIDIIIDRADKAMYKAKEKGGNRVEIIK